MIEGVTEEGVHDSNGLEWHCDYDGRTYSWLEYSVGGDELGWAWTLDVNENEWTYIDDDDVPGPVMQAFVLWSLTR